MEQIKCERVSESCLIITIFLYGIAYCYLFGLQPQGSSYETYALQILPQKRTGLILLHVDMWLQSTLRGQFYFSLFHPRSLLMLSCKHACNVVQSNYKIHANRKIKHCYQTNVSCIARQTEKSFFCTAFHLFIEVIKWSYAIQITNDVHGMVMYWLSVSGTCGMFCTKVYKIQRCLRASLRAQTYQVLLTRSLVSLKV